MMFTGISHHQTQRIKQKMHELRIFEKDIKEDFVRSSSAGGQNVNKVSTCVCLSHRPTGIQVKCQSERTQGLNRLKARWILVKKIEEINFKRQQELIDKKEKERRRNRKRPQSLKENILQNKKQHSEKKASRKKVNFGQFDY